ncbi:MAG: aldo/keto reductase [Bacteroidaceae bacterium]|nr:aldo/keto reductase [Bacteroidaceae bacterium]
MRDTLVENSMKLGFGMMRLPKIEGTQDIDLEHTKRMVDAFIEAGGKYFDTAYIYEGSEPATKVALCDRYPRESYYLADKLNASDFACKSEEEAKNEIKVSLERTGAGYFDFYLLHGIDAGNKEKYAQYGIWDYMRKLKAEGLIRHYGFSFHSTPELLEELLTEHPDIEFVQLQINYSDWEDPLILSRRCYEIATRHGKPIIVMEPVKGGKLADPPQQVKDILLRANPHASFASWAIRFAASLPNVMMVLSGMSNMEQMEDNLSFMRQLQPLDEGELKVLETACKSLSQSDIIGCTACHYCTPGCPMDIHIPEIFAVMNVYKMYGDLKEARNDYQWRPGGEKASACVQCGQCEDACPQHLPIISLLEDVVKTLEE